MKKILYLLECNINTIGGSQKSTSTIINEMLNYGYEVGIFMPSKLNMDIKENNNFNDTCYIYTIEDTKKMKKINSLFYRIKELRKCIKSYKPDIIHSQSPSTTWLLGILLKFGLIDKNIKCYCTDRGFLLEYSKIAQKLFKLVGNTYETIVTTTKINQDNWNNNVRLRKSVCIPNALEDEWFEYDEIREKELRSKHNVKNTFNIGFCSRYLEYKRWDTVMEICTALSKCDNIKFIIAVTADNDYRRKQMNEYLEKMKEILGEKLILFVDADKEKIKEFYYILDAFILTSEGESFGRTLIEAMTKNNLVFGTNSGGVPDVINNSKFLFEVGNIEEICTKIERYMNDSKNMEKAKKNFMEYVKSKYTIEKLRQEHLRLYNN